MGGLFYRIRVSIGYMLSVGLGEVQRLMPHTDLV
jgi:hypothetical protein